MVSFNKNWKEYLQSIDKQIVIITDDNLFRLYGEELKSFPHVVIPNGEASKSIQMISDLVQELVNIRVDRGWHLVGFGGGVVTDITGFLASIYMRGIEFSFISTSLLGMVDASIGGKNGVDFKQYKNLIGCFNNPKNIIIDSSILSTLSDVEWSNGFAEIIKHACIRDYNLFNLLEHNNIKMIQANDEVQKDIIQRSTNIKIKVVEEDWKESGIRKILNFGHTFGHAIENTHRLPHGQSISLGIIIALQLSEKYLGFDKRKKERIINLLKQYNLPTYIDLRKKIILDTLSLDKKRDNTSINFILLEDIGKAIVKHLSLQEVEYFFEDFSF